jgi:hypothetical protein
MPSQRTKLTAKPTNMPSQRTKQPPRYNPMPRTAYPIDISTPEQRATITTSQFREIQQAHSKYLVLSSRFAKTANQHALLEMQTAYAEATALVTENPGKYPSIMPSHPTPSEARRWRQEMVDPFVDRVPMSLLEYVPSCTHPSCCSPLTIDLDQACHYDDMHLHRPRFHIQH